VRLGDGKPNAAPDDGDTDKDTELDVTGGEPGVMPFEPALDGT